MRRFNHGKLFSRNSSVLGKALAWCERQVWIQKMNNPLGVVLLLLGALSMAYVLSSLDFKSGFVLYVVLVGAPLIVYCLFNVAFNVGMMLCVALLVPFATKFATAPIGTLLDLLILIGGLWLLWRRVFTWHVPVALLATVLVLAAGFNWLNPERFAGPAVHLLSGGLMLGAFFIATDPVSACTTPRGRATSSPDTRTASRCEVGSTSSFA
mgnify:CR=1 FL=1